MMGVAGRLSVALITSLLAALTVLGGSLMVNLGHYLTTQAYDEAVTVARQTSRLASQGGVDGQRLSLSDPGMLGAAMGRSGLYLQISEGNRIIQRSPSLKGTTLPLTTPTPQVLKWGFLPLWGTATPLTMVHHIPTIFARSSVTRHNHVIGWVEVGISLSSALRSIRTVGGGLVRVGAATLVITSLLSTIFIYQSFHRIRRLSRVARRIETADDLGRRIAVQGPRDEVRELAQSFNHMLNRLENSFQGERLITAQASHQLRTPLATAIGYASMLRKWGQSDPALVSEGLEVIHEQLSRLQTVIDIVLRLAELEGHSPIVLEKIPIERFIQEWKKTQPVPILIIGGPSSTVMIDKGMMTEALNILVDNVQHHAGPNPSVQISWQMGSDKSVTIVLQDQGPGFPPEILPHLFHPFAKDAKSSGTGLGLALARAMIERQGGHIAALNAFPRGARLYLTFPSTCV